MHPYTLTTYTVLTLFVRSFVSYLAVLADTSTLAVVLGTCFLVVIVGFLAPLHHCLYNNAESLSVSVRVFIFCATKFTDRYSIFIMDRRSAV